MLIDISTPLKIVISTLVLKIVISTPVKIDTLSGLFNHDLHPPHLLQ